MTGFKNTKQLWRYLKPRLRGSWHRVEVITPEGFPDAIGKHEETLIFLELKAGADKLRSSQKIFLSWLPETSCRRFVVYGSGENKTVWFTTPEGDNIICPSFWMR